MVISDIQSILAGPDVDHISGTHCTSIHGVKFSWNSSPYTQMGRYVMEGLHFLASLPLAGARQREGGGFSCINKRIISHPVTLIRYCRHVKKGEG